MGKIKERLIEDMIKYPEYYNGWVDYEFWMQCRKEELLKREEINNNTRKHKGDKDGKVSTR